MKRVLVLGGTGMLGSMVVDHLARLPGLAVTATARTEGQAEAAGRSLASAEWRTFDALSAESAAAAELLAAHDWVVNCIGIIKPFIRDDNAPEVERAVRVNALLPHVLARRAGGRVLQIATDCVFSGERGGSRESDAHDPVDVYGRTKSLGEVRAPHMHHLRCSVIGPERAAPRSLLGWLLGQPPGATVNGFTNHRWNGVTTLHFARLCGGVIERDLPLPHMVHVIPGDTLTKCELLESAARTHGRSDLVVTPMAAETVVDRTLSTDDEAANRGLWVAAGYAAAPAVEAMLAELAGFESGWRPVTASGGAG